MKSITENKRSIPLKLPTLCLALIAMWNYRKYGYSVKAIIKGILYGYSRMRNGYKGKNKEKRINQMMLFAKHHLLQNIKTKTN
jgi:hypothetical protein